MEQRIRELEEAVVELASHVHQLGALQQTMIDALHKRLEAAERLLSVNMGDKRCPASLN